MLKNSIIIKRNKNYFMYQKENLVFITKKNAELLKKIENKENYEFSKKMAEIKFSSLTLRKIRNFKLEKIKKVY